MAQKIISEHVAKNVIALYGHTGKQWLDNFPEFNSRYENAWNFKVKSCFLDAQFNVVLDVMQNDGVPAVFKCCVPNKEFKTEVFSLQHYDGYGAVRLLQSDIDHGAMLLEKIMPGSILELLPDIELATQYALDVCKKLHKPIEDGHSFPKLSDWFLGFDRLYKKFDNTSGPFSSTLIEKAKKVSFELLSSQSTLVLLHGDLHYANLILNKDHCVAIDPKGIIGEPQFEIPLPRVTNPTSKKELLYRLDCLIDQSQFDQKRIYSWLFCKAMLAAWWTVEDSGSSTDLTAGFISVADIMNDFV